MIDVFLNQGNVENDPDERAFCLARAYESHCDWYNYAPILAPTLRIALRDLRDSRYVLWHAKRCAARTLVLAT